MRNVIRSLLGTTAVVVLIAGAGCARSVDATPPKSGGSIMQTPARSADNMNAAGVGYSGGASENVNRDTTPAPTSIGGGPTAGDSTDSPGTSGTDSTGSDMTGDVKAPDSPKDKKKSAPSPGTEIK